MEDRPMKLFENASWLWKSGYENAENVYIDFFETFTVDTPANRYTMHISADANYAVYVNGTLVNFGQYSDYETYKVYDSIALTGIVPGKNEIKITVHGRGKNFSTYRIGHPGVIYEIYADDTLFIISSDETKMAVNPCYKQGPVEIVTGQLGFSYHYDATKEGTAVGLCAAEVIEKSKVLYPRPIKKLIVGDNQNALLYAQGVFMDSRMENLNIAQKMQYAFLSARDQGTLCGHPGGSNVTFPNADGITFHCDHCDNVADGMYLTFDLGIESAGIFSIDIDVPKDTEILVGWGEHLDDLRPRTWIGRCFALRYKAHAGRNTFSGPFLRLGLRYLQLHIYSERATVYYAGIKPTDYPLDYTPYFKCDDHLHNKIYEVCLRTLQTCMHEHYEDCPWREQALYSMDSRNQMLCGYYTFGETEFAKAAIRLMALSLREDGMLELCSPAVVSITIPSFSAIFVTQLQEYLLYSGDFAFAEEMMPTARAIVAAFTAQLDNEKQLLKCRKESIYWNFYEWQSGLDGHIGGSMDEEDRTYDAPMNAFFSMALRSIAKLEQSLGNHTAAKDYLAQKAALDARMNALFWDAEHGVYASFVKGSERYHYAELTNALIVYTDACPADKEDSVLAALAAKTMLPVTLSHSIFKYESLLRRPDKYAKAVFDEIADVFGTMLYNNATTFYETVDGARAFSNAGSLCHGWSAIPTYLYHAYVLGLKPTEDGYASYEIKPLDTGIHGAEGLVITPRGTITL
ncbi:MAG: hypothetical protein E7604_09705 [Ruminococcaceae bacterium]|nr:hypothetical protein [Oscillospiraceae bacterium]